MKMPINRVDFLGVGFDQITLDAVVARLRGVGANSPYSYVATPNVDHVVRLSRSADRAALINLYTGADLCVCDSRVLRMIARFHRIVLPVVPGSDLTARVMRDVVERGDLIAIVGADTALVADLAARFPNVSFAHHVPPMGLRHNAVAIREAARFVAMTKARFTMLAVGSPQQEMIAAAVRQIPGATGTALCIGVSLDFLTGRQRRAPRWVQRLSLEWAHRLVAEPRRLARRYLVEGPRIFLLAARYRRDGAPR
jgi:N-acetylglucosaminyldiphosphoundecaprenol N-acetyl-beta-D-mannosaminyltransferase